MISPAKIDRKYTNLVSNIGKILGAGKQKAYVTLNTVLVRTYWEIGKEIAEYEQAGKQRADYGESLLQKLSSDLKQTYGKGFGISNIQYMRLIYLKYRKHQTLSGKLGWSHYVSLLSVDDDLERKFYER